MEGADKSALVTAMGRDAPFGPFAPEACVLEQVTLPFYPDSVLLRATVQGLSQPLWYARLPEQMVRLDGGIARIHACNDIGPLRLNDDTVHAYLRFHYYFSGGRTLFEARIKRSAVGYTGKLWVFERAVFHEQDVNITPRGVIIVLDDMTVPDVPELMDREFSF